MTHGHNGALLAFEFRNQEKSHQMAAYDNMSQVELRSELTSRGLIVRGIINNLRERLPADDTRGIFDGCFENMVKKDLVNLYKSLHIHSAGERRVLISRIKEYNLRKSGGQRGGEEKGGVLTRIYQLQRIG